VSRLVCRFRDGSVDNETATFSQQLSLEVLYGGDAPFLPSGLEQIISGINHDLRQCRNVAVPDRGRHDNQRQVLLVREVDEVAEGS
jgi:hypothetical protein